MNDVNSLAHTQWNCKYHNVFAPKYRRKVFFGEKRREIGKILRQLCDWKKVPGSYPYAGRDSAKSRGFELRRISKREEFADAV